MPVGPDTSFLAAEIVLTAVDLTLATAIPNLRGFRYIDDYELTFQSRAEAEEALVTLESALAEYELTLNPAKTTIEDLPRPLREHWPHELLTFTIRNDTPSRRANDTIALFSRAADFAQHHPGALKYALLKSREVEVSRDFWHSFQSLVWSAVSAAPTTAAAALDLLARIVHGSA